MTATSVTDPQGSVDGPTAQESARLPQVVSKPLRQAVGAPGPAPQRRIPGARPAERAALDDDHGDEELAVSRADIRAAAARRADHMGRLLEVLRYEPCSPRCANWLRYGTQPRNSRPGMRPGCCRAKAHRPSHHGYGGRRVLVSRKWTAKDLADHRHDRRAHVVAVLGRTPDGQPTNSASGESSATAVAPADDAMVWELAKTTDPDVDPLQCRILRAVAHATLDFATGRSPAPLGSWLTALAAWRSRFYFVRLAPNTQRCGGRVREVVSSKCGMATQPQVGFLRLRANTRPARRAGPIVRPP
jgi:hypothetical protein